MRLRAIAAAGTALALTSVGLLPADADAVTWAPAPTATIHPGVQMESPSGQCTANFVFTNGSEILIGFAAHCVGEGAATDIDGCTTDSLPIGTPVTIEGASQPGVLVYSSWLAMQAAGESDDDACLYNDLGLVRIAAADVGKVNPSVPHWGGPTGINTTGNPALSLMYSYGNSSLRQGITLLSPKAAISVGTNESGWSHTAYTVTPGIPGDSGSAYLDASGRATGVLSTLGLAPLPLSNGIGDLDHELNYARTHGLPNVALALGTEPFNGNQLPLGL